MHVLADMSDLGLLIFLFLSTGWRCMYHFPPRILFQEKMRTVFIESRTGIQNLGRQNLSLKSLPSQLCSALDLSSCWGVQFTIV
jgi:hypothetical protein